MTEYKIIGIAEKDGNYQGSPWHNMYLYCTYPNNANNVLGEEGVKFKIRWADVPQAFGLGSGVFKLADFIQLVGKKAFIYFDRYGTATEVRVIKEDKPVNNGNKS